MWKNSFIIISLIICCHLNVFAGGPWMKLKNAAYFQVGYNYISPNNKLFSKEYVFFDLPYKLSDQTISFYGEYGLSDRLTIVAYLPYKITGTEVPLIRSNSIGVIYPDPNISVKDGELNGFGNISLGGKYRIMARNNWILSSEINISSPSKQLNKLAQLRTGYDSWSFQPLISIGSSGKKYYTFANLAYNYRPQLTDEYRIGIETGYKIYKSILGILTFDLLQSTEKLKPRKDQFTFLYPDQQAYISSTIKLSLPLGSNIGLNLHMTIKTIAANYVQKGPAMGVSFYWKV